MFLNALTAACRAGADNPVETVEHAFTIARAGYRPESGQFEPFLMAIVRNVGRADLRKEWNWQKRKVALPEDAEFVDESAKEANEQLLAEMDRPYLRKTLAQALRRMDWRKRQYLWLRFWKHMSNEEIFSHPNCMLENPASCSGRKSRVHRAVIALRALYFGRSPRPSCPSVASKRPGCARRQSKRSSCSPGASPCMPC